MRLGGSQHLPGFLLAQRQRGLRPLDRGGIDQGGDVARDLAALQGDAEGPGEHPVCAQDRGGAQAFVGERAVEAFQVLRLQSVEPVVPDAGAKV
jgi:hypothetical protein